MHVKYFFNPGIMQGIFFFSVNGQRVTGLVDIIILYTPLLANVLYLRPKPVVGEAVPPPPTPVLQQVNMAFNLRLKKSPGRSNQALFTLEIY